MFEIGDVMRWSYGRIFGRPMNFSFIDECVAGSAKPMQKKEIDWLRRRGIEAVLSITEDPLTSEWIKGMPYLNVPVRDHHSPTQEELRLSVDFLISETSKGKKIVAHCAAGSGRTGTILAAYMCRKYGLSAKEAIARIREKRPGSIEKKQEEAVRIFANGLKHDK